MKNVVSLIVLRVGGRPVNRVGVERFRLDVRWQRAEPRVTSVSGPVGIVQELDVGQIEPRRRVFIAGESRRPVGDLGGRECLVAVIHVHRQGKTPLTQI